MRRLLTSSLRQPYGQATRQLSVSQSARTLTHYRAARNASMSKDTYTSWGNYPPHQQGGEHLPIHCQNYVQNTPSSLLPFGNGRSYGDVCLNPNGKVIDSNLHDCFMQFCPESGKIECQGGVLLASILDLVIPHGWFLTVTPGTQYVTLGGAIANDVHGKNHHRVGSFGNHLIGFKLLRSNGEILTCSPQENSPLFCATIGGLGLTGVILSAEFQLTPIHNSDIIQQSIRFKNLSEFFSLAKESDSHYEYTVAWVDCLATGKHTGRGIFLRGNHSATPQTSQSSRSKPVLQVPFTPPISLINRWTLKAFNQFYYHKQSSQKPIRQVTANAFFYPLDRIKKWNRIYGPKGFLQHQCVVPMENAETAIAELLNTISRHRSGSFLAVLKTFGTIQSRGLLSFPRPGTTLALDFPYRGKSTEKLFAQLNQIVIDAGGALYPAKDATMSPDHFQQSFPRHEEFSGFIDPQFDSSFWQRVTANKNTSIHPNCQRARS